jgi:PPK2 family polyphosphate:nucleotide phosphotransferase
MKRYLVGPGSKFRLKDVAPGDSGDFDPHDGGELEVRERTQKIIEKLDDLQERLYAESDQSLLIVFQGMDTSGKDGVIKHVMSGVNPQGCRVSSFKAPTHDEASHDVLWRIHRETPAKGFIGIFNRSHYEDVIFPSVHKQISDKIVEKRYRQINDFERLLGQNGTVVLKFFLHISKEEQRERLQARADDPKKHWKFNINDVRERRFWDDYQKAFEEMLRETSTKHAPWMVVPANHKWYRDYLVGKAVVRALEDMKLEYPKGPKDVDFRKLKIN